MILAAYNLILMQLQPEKQVQHFTELGLPMHDLPSELNCIFVFGFPHEDKLIPQNQNKKPIRVTFKSTDLKTLTIQNIREKYLKLLPASAKKKNLRFTLSKGFVLKLRSTLAEVKNLLRRQSIDGIVLFTFQGVTQFDSDDQDQDVDYNNQCGIMDYIHQQPSFDAEYNYTIHFNLPKSNYVISITISPSELVSTLQNLFFKEVYKVFGREITLDDVKEFKIKESKETLVGTRAIGKHRGLFDDSEIDVVLSGKVKLEQAMLENYPMTLIKEWINVKTNAKMSKSQVVNYYEVRGMQISKIREAYFAGQENPNNPSCLKVMEFILRPRDRLNLLDSAVLKLRDLGKVRLVGYFITEKMLFYRDVPQILGAGASQFSLDQLEIPSEQVPQKQKCKKLVSERLNNIQPGYFQDRTRIEPILIYTSNLKYVDQKSKQVLKIYSSLNQSLRNKSIFDLKPHEIAKQWVFRYTSTLLRHLQNIQGVKDKVYRGVDYDPDAKKGDLITFKPFTSTSKNMQVSLLFALQALAGEDENPVITMFEMEVLSGKPISKFSYFSTEEEFLLQPYTEFVVKEVKSKEVRFPDCEDGTVYPYRYYCLQQVISPREMPNVSNNYILWVDDKKNEGLQTFNRFIQEFNSPTVLFQIQSTIQLQKWMNQRTQIINDTSSKILMVTNMVRTEQGERNFYAGVDSINLVRKVLPNIPIIVYVGDKQASENNLNDKQVSRENLEVINRFEDFIRFVERHLNLKFSLVPKEPPKEEPKEEQIKGKEKSSKFDCELM